MSVIIEYHKNTKEIAILRSDNQYWIGTFCKYLTHQTAEPPFIFINGYWQDLEAAQAVLSTMTGDEF